jgi:hypothetical protein
LSKRAVTFAIKTAIKEVAQFMQSSTPHPTDMPNRNLAPEFLQSVTQAVLHDKSTQKDLDIEMFRSVLEAGKEAKKSAMIINAGACVATLAFLGNLLPKSATLIQDFPDALLSFAAGVLFVAISNGLAYPCQHYYRYGPRWLGNAVNSCAIGLVVVSYFCFARGCWIAYAAFQNLK